MRRGRARAWRRGDGAGRRLPPVRVPAGLRAGARAASCSTTSAACCSRSRARTAAVDGFLAPARGGGAAAGGGRGGAPARRRAARASAASASSRAPRGGEPTALVSPDTATCDDCLRELFDPADRRYRYPFVNCTNCGPRFTIVPRRPLRPAAHDDGRLRDVRRAARPSTRTRPTGASTPSPTPARSAGRRCGCSATAAATRRCASAVAAGAARAAAIVAVKGIGGYHLACLAARRAAVAALRARKHREDKPFAVMVRDVAAARELVELTDEEAALLRRPRPPDRARAAPAAARRSPPSVAPRSRRPRRDAALLAAAPPAAGRRRRAAGDDERQRLRRADRARGRRRARRAWRGSPTSFLVHDRPIHTRTDDSVLRAVARAGGRCCCAARAGSCPARSRCRCRRRAPLLACGAELKSTFCVAKGARAWVGHHIGDLKNYEMLQPFEAGIEHFERLFAVAPEVVAHDLHPDYLSTRYALDARGRRARRRSSTTTPTSRRAWPSTARPAARSARSTTAPGYGTRRHGLGRRAAGRRPARLRARRAPLAGAAARRRPAVREPWRMACAWLLEAGWERRRARRRRTRSAGRRSRSSCATGLASP